MSLHAKGLQAGNVASASQSHVLFTFIVKICFESLIGTKNYYHPTLQYKKALRVGVGAVSWKHAGVCVHVLEKRFTFLHPHSTPPLLSSPTTAVLTHHCCPHPPLQQLLTSPPQVRASTGKAAAPSYCDACSKLCCCLQPASHDVGARAGAGATATTATTINIELHLFACT